jgi:HSP20 family protein
MRFSRWQPFQSGVVFDQLQQFQHEMNRLFDRWGGNGPRRGTGEFPAINMWEDADHVFLQAELPGLDLKDLEIYVTGGNQLSIKGNRKPVAPEKGVWHRQERAFGEFGRIVTLPFAVDPDRVEARFENGVLQVQLAKHESAKPRKINVKAE